MTGIVLKAFRARRGNDVVDFRPGDRVPVRDARKAEGIIRAGYLRLVPPDSSGQPQAVKIWSEVVCDEIWLLLHPGGQSYIPEGAVIYTPEEIRNLKDASTEEVRAVHRVKKSLGGHLIMVKEREGVTT